MQQHDNQRNFPGRHWSVLDDGRVQCNVCPRQCQLRDGKRGFCFVRQNVGNEMVLTTYGRSSGFCIDPIEKKPLNHFYPGSSVLSFGTAGCNLGCRFCQNWDISKAREMDTLQADATPDQIADLAKGLNCKSVAFTYNDPVIFMEYAIDVAKECKQRDVQTVAVTAGYMLPESRREFYSHIDAANIDLKAFTDTFYSTLCFAELGPVLDTLKYLKNETDVWFEITTLLIPDQNDSEAEIAQLSDWIMTNLGPYVPLHFSAFHPDFKMMDTPHTPIETLQMARKVAMDHGLQYVYTGNVHDTNGDRTICPSCKENVIERDWYELTGYYMNDNTCQFCNDAIHGVFSSEPGNWGRKRVPVNIES